MSPAPDGEHEDYISTVIRQVLTRSVVSMDASGNQGLLMPSKSAPKNHVIPDLTLAPRELRLFRSASSWMPPGGVAMLVEVTSQRPFIDRTTKRHCFARAGIPLYLVVDRNEVKVVLHSEPSQDDYVRVVSVAFGEPLSLPESFGFALETSDFL